MVIDIIIMHDFDFNFYSSCCFLLFANYMALAGTACCTSASGLLYFFYVRLRTYAQYASLSDFTCSQHSIRSSTRIVEAYRQSFLKLSVNFQPNSTKI